MADSLQQSEDSTPEALNSFSLVPNIDQPILDLDSTLIKSDYAKVVFHDVADVYLTDADVCCRYTVTAGVVSAHGDRVGIYRVGWTSPHDYVLFEWAPVPQARSSEQEWEMQVLFSARQLPKDDGEFYQICYVKVDGSVAGASTPFQFRRPTEEELCELEDSEEELVVVRSRTAVAEERIRQIAQRNEELLENQMVLEEKHLKLLELSESLSEQLHKKTQRIDELQSQLQTMLSKEDFERELKVVKQESMSQLKDDIDALKMEKNKLEQKIAKNDQYIQELQDTIKVLSSDKDQIVGLLHEETRQKSILHDERELLTTRLDDMSHMLEAMSQSKDMASVEIHTHLTEKEKLTSEIRELKQKLEDSEESQDALEGKMQILVKQLNEQKQENEAQRQQSEAQLQEKEDDRITLTLQCSTLEKQVQEYKEKLVAAEAVNENLQKQVADLHNRMQMALVEYQQLYTENYRLQKKFQKAQQKKDRKHHSVTVSGENHGKELTEPLKTEESDKTQEQEKGYTDKNQVVTSSDMYRTQETADGHNRETGETSHEELRSSVTQDKSDNYKNLYEIAQDKIRDMETQLRMVTLDQRTAKLQQFQELQQLKEEIRQMKYQSEDQSNAASQPQMSEQGNCTAENLECLSDKSHASVDPSAALPIKQDSSQKQNAEDRSQCFSEKTMKERNDDVETSDQSSKGRISDEPNYLYPYPPVPLVFPRPPLIPIPPLGFGEGLRYPANVHNAIRPPWNAVYTTPSCHPYPGAINMWTTNYSYPYPQPREDREHPVAPTQALPSEMALQGRGQSTEFVKLHTNTHQYGRAPEENGCPSQPLPKMQDAAFQGPAMESGEKSEIRPVAYTLQNISDERNVPISNIKAKHEPSVIPQTSVHQQSSASCHPSQRLGENLGTGDFTNPGILDVTPSGTLPPPIEPEVLPQARLAAMSAVNRSTMAVKDKTSETQHISQEATLGRMPDSPLPDAHTEASSVVQESSQTKKYQTEQPKGLDCPFCPVTFPGNNISEMDIHLETHLDLCCPVCCKLYPKSSQEEFEFHVQEHFSDDEGSHFEYVSAMNDRPGARWVLDFD